MPCNPSSRRYFANLARRLCPRGARPPDGAARLGSCADWIFLGVLLKQHERSIVLDEQRAGRRGPPCPRLIVYGFDSLGAPP
ncbi:hypothetical protein HYQ46_006244 [Verticillium longisporum]|nr:hypothetical protein HYQ46_006244 [Verticillium longisporum]